MIFEEIVMNLINSIQARDLEATKKYTDLLNQIDNISVTDLTTMLDAHNIDAYDLDNECFDYILLHLNSISRPDIVRWQRKKLFLINSQNKTDIENFICEQLNNKTFNIDNTMFIRDIIQLTVNLKDRDKISKIFDKIKTQLKE